MSEPQRDSRDGAPAPGRRHRPASERRAQILDAALACFARKGYARTTMDDLVRASGLSKGSLYWHFESKEEVLLASFDHFVEGFFEARGEPEAIEGPILPWVLETGRILIRRVDQERPWVEVWLEFLAHEGVRARFAELYRESRDILGRAVARAIERGEARALDPGGVAALLVGVSEGLLLQAIMDEEFDAAGQWETTAAVLLEGIRA